MRRWPASPRTTRSCSLQGGASLQFSVLPMNLLTQGSCVADYIITGDWSKKALKEAKRVGATNVAASTEESLQARPEGASEIKHTPGAAYVHMTSNNTTSAASGTRRRKPAARRWCVTRHRTSFAAIEVAKWIYAGAQKTSGRRASPS